MAVDYKWQEFRAKFDAKQEGEALQLVVPMRQGLYEPVRKKLRARVWPNGNHRTVDLDMGGAWAEELGDFAGLDGQIWQSTISVLYWRAMIKLCRERFKALKHHLKCRGTAHPPTDQDLERLSELQQKVRDAHTEMGMQQTQLTNLQDKRHYPGLTPKQIRERKKEHAEAAQQVQLDAVGRLAQLDNMTI